MNDLLLGLRKYFSETPRDQVLTDWAKTVSLDNDCGIKACDFLSAEDSSVSKEVKTKRDCCKMAKIQR